VAGLAALIAAGTVARRALAGRLTGWRRVIARDLIVSTLASIVSLPLIARTFGRMSLVAPVANLAAGPIFTVLQPTLFLALGIVSRSGCGVAASRRRPRAAPGSRYRGQPRDPRSIRRRAGGAVTWTAVLLGVVSLSVIVGAPPRREAPGRGAAPSAALERSRSWSQGYRSWVVVASSSST
jgi:hypothetical protein